MYSQIYFFFFSPDAIALLFFTAVSTSSVLLIGAVFVDFTKEAKERILQEKEKQRQEKEKKDEVNIDTSDTPSTGEKAIVGADITQESSVIVELNYLQAVKTLNLWLIFFAVGVVGGAGLVFLNVKKKNSVNFVHAQKKLRTQDLWSSLWEERTEIRPSLSPFSASSIQPRDF